VGWRLVSSRGFGWALLLACSLKAQLLSEFDLWFTAQGGGDGEGAEAAAVTATDDGDVLDDGEAFDRLEMERVASQDPDSLAYFNAQKRMRSTLRSTHRGRRR